MGTAPPVWPVGRRQPHTSPHPLPATQPSDLGTVGARSAPRVFGVRVGMGSHPPSSPHCCMPTPCEAPSQWYPEVVPTRGRMLRLPPDPAVGFWRDVEVSLPSVGIQGDDSKPHWGAEQAVNKQGWGV